MLLRYQSFGSLKYPSLQILILQVMLSYYENTSVNFCCDHTHFGTRIDHTLHYLSLAYPQNIFHFSNLPFHFKVLIQ